MRLMFLKPSLDSIARQICTDKEHLSLWSEDHDSAC